MYYVASVFAVLLIIGYLWHLEPLPAPQQQLPSLPGQFDLRLVVWLLPASLQRELLPHCNTQITSALYVKKKTIFLYMQFQIKNTHKQEIRLEDAISWYKAQKLSHAESAQRAKGY